MCGQGQVLWIFNRPNARTVGGTTGHRAYSGDPSSPDHCNIPPELWRKKVNDGLLPLPCENWIPTQCELPMIFLTDAARKRFEVSPGQFDQTLAQTHATNLGAEITAWLSGRKLRREGVIRGRNEVCICFEIHILA